MSTTYRIRIENGSGFEQALDALHSLRRHLDYLADGSDARYDADTHLWTVRLTDRGADSGPWSEVCLLADRGLDIDPG